MKKDFLIKTDTGDYINKVVLNEWSDATQSGLDSFTCTPMKEYGKRFTLRQAKHFMKLFGDKKFISNGHTITRRRIAVEIVT